MHLVRGAAGRRRCHPRPAGGSRTQPVRRSLQRVAVGKVPVLGRRLGAPRLEGCPGGTLSGPGSRRASEGPAGAVSQSPAAGTAPGHGDCPPRQRRGVWAMARAPGCCRHRAAGRWGCVGRTAGPWGTEGCRGAGTGHSPSVQNGPLCHRWMSSGGTLCYQNAPGWGWCCTGTSVGKSGMEESEETIGGQWGRSA